MNNIHKTSNCFYFKFTLSGLMQMHYMNPNNLLDFMNILTIDRITMFFVHVAYHRQFVPIQILY
jgi:hypothetical protein